ncbi:hypothetical protein HMN09_00326800 [Mycena chlorophos]|uniref:Tyr recombinase domain-containing protein n=1 Tax=Mycena chlorophos TaxID=658473 RepID=A0A8H6TJ02_MYCCL|nr:hypothetical protein HMN09_00326800 [Mycena chlorophos]
MSLLDQTASTATVLPSSQKVRKNASPWKETKQVMGVLPARKAARKKATSLAVMPVAPPDPTPPPAKRRKTAPKPAAATVPQILPAQSTTTSNNSLPALPIPHYSAYPPYAHPQPDLNPRMGAYSPTPYYPMAWNGTCVLQLLFPHSAPALMSKRPSPTTHSPTTPKGLKRRRTSQTTNTTHNSSVPEPVHPSSHVSPPNAVPPSLSVFMALPAASSGLVHASAAQQFAFANQQDCGPATSPSWAGWYPDLISGTHASSPAPSMPTNGHFDVHAPSPTSRFDGNSIPAHSPTASACYSVPQSTPSVYPHFPATPPVFTPTGRGSPAGSTSSSWSPSSNASTTSEHSPFAPRVDEIDDEEETAPPVGLTRSNTPIEPEPESIAAQAYPDATPEEERILVEADLHDLDDIVERVHEVIDATMLKEFPESDADDALAQTAASIARQSITQSTRDNHVGIIKSYILFHWRRDREWEPTRVNEDTPRDITLYITRKCGPVANGGEGRKFSTAVSTRAALTLWYRSLRPNESLSEWRFDEVTQVWYVVPFLRIPEFSAYRGHLRRGLPTRSPYVSRFMMGLEKTKAKAGEISHSARALRLEDMHRLYDECIMKRANSLAGAKTSRERTNATQEYRAGVVRYAAYLIAWLMLLRVDEVVSLEFENIEHIPGERKYFEVRPKTRKTAQTGITHPWRLHANDKDPKICPMRAMIRLAMVYRSSGVTWSGPMFLQVTASGAIDQTRPLTSSVLSRALSKDLQSIGYSTWALYGTHSFRRGGCQYRVEVKGWPIAQVAAWGGWSLIEATTMFRYFYSPDDNHELMHDYDKNY